MSATLSCLSPKEFTDPTWPLESPWRKSSAVSRTDARIASIALACKDCMPKPIMYPRHEARYNDWGRAYQKWVFCAEPLMVGTGHAHTLL